ncbi:MAG: Fic family protein [Cyanobacteria bacterium]|nr:Fic family protein [Cyanobacteriota bacterium]
MRLNLNQVFSFFSRHFKTNLLELAAKSPYNKLSPGYLTVIEGRHNAPLLAFVPNPLPPKNWSPSQEVFIGLDRVETALKMLEQKALQSHLLPSMLIAPLILEDIKLRNTPDENMGKTIYMGDYIRQLFLAIRDECDLPFSMERFSQWHQGIFTGPNWQHRGLFRTESLVFTRRENEELSYYFTPPYEPMLKCMADLEAFMNQDQRYPPLIKLALFFYQFLAIHPFGDGNGRMTRFFTTFNLIQTGYLTKPYFFVGPYLNTHREEYIQSLDQVRYYANWDVWVTYFLSALENTALALSHRLDNIESLFQQGVETLLNDNALHKADIADINTAQKIMQVLFKDPLGEVEYWRKLAPTLSTDTWQLALKSLQDAQLLTPRMDGDDTEPKVEMLDQNLSGDPPHKYSSLTANWALTPLIELLNAPLFPI